MVEVEEMGIQSVDGSPRPGKVERRTLMVAMIARWRLRSCGGFLAFARMKFGDDEVKWDYCCWFD